MKSVKIPYIISTDIEFLVEKIDGYAINPVKSSTTKLGELFPLNIQNQQIEHLII